MNFSQYLKKRQLDFGYRTIKEHFEALGGKTELGMTVRYFQQIVNDERPPTERVLSSIFEQTQSTEKKLLVVAYFKSTLHLKEKSNSLVKYLEGHLSHAIETPSKGFWKSKITPEILNEDQMNLLIEDRDAFKSYNKILLYEKLPVSIFNQSTVKRLITSNLVKVNGKLVEPFSRYMIFPSIKNSDHYLTSLGTKCMLKAIDTFISKEGHPRQRVETFSFLIPKDVSEKILSEIGNFLEWAKSLAKEAPNQNVDNKEVVPFFISIFGKELEERDL